MLSVTTEYHGSLDDLIPEFPDYRFVLTRSELEQVAEKEILIPFQQLDLTFQIGVSEWWLKWEKIIKRSMILCCY
ncbi:MAG: hypothetical protein EZS28_047982 [Streblomastix strix]|uniref:Uncharacterized protein n=1 Tax=Streblomastix strix TaxID=222440 RepID=A0A5J4TFV2_9EUKA|nr:MAG: hypothetical protein EZS28_047982 [Streblomastix strix]